MKCPYRKVITKTINSSRELTYTEYADCYGKECRAYLAGDCIKVSGYLADASLVRSTGELND